MKKISLIILVLLVVSSSLFAQDGVSSATQQAKVIAEQHDFSSWNMTPYHLDQTLITIGGSSLIRWGSAPDNRGFPVRWYGLSYILAVMTSYMLLSWYLKKEKNPLLTIDQLDGALTWIIGGIVIGARMGYVVFYNLPYFLQHPLEIILPFRDGHFVGISGMSYHGGLIGIIIAVAIFLKREKLCFWKVSPLFFWVAPLGYTWGRLGNFINGELYGRVTTHPIGMLFPQAPSVELRHPSQLYEAFSEGIVVFALLTFFRRYEWGRKATIPLYLIGYGIARFGVEFFREPDDFIGLNALGMSRGQMLSSAMIVVAIGIWIVQKKTTLLTCKESAPQEL